MLSHLLHAQAHLQLLKIPDFHIKVLLMPRHPVINLPGQVLVVTLQVLLNHLTHLHLLFKLLSQLMFFLTHAHLTVDLAALVHLDVCLSTQTSISET